MLEEAATRVEAKRSLAQLSVMSSAFACVMTPEGAKAYKQTADSLEKRAYGEHN